MNQFKIYIFLFLNLNSYLVFCNEENITDLYFCTGADSKYYNNLLNLIGSIHKTNFDNLKEIAVYNLGLSNIELENLNKIQKVKTYEIELTHPDLLKQFKMNNEGKEVPGWYAWKPVAIKQSLEIFPYVLWIDAGMAVLKPLDNLFRYIKKNKYFLCNLASRNVDRQTTKYLKDKFKLNMPENGWILGQMPVVGFIMGGSREAIDILFGPFYEFTKDLRNFEDDGSAPEGFGNGRHDQALLSIFAYLNNLKVNFIDYYNSSPIMLDDYAFYLSIDKIYFHQNTDVYYLARFDENHNKYAAFIKYRDKSE